MCNINPHVRLESVKFYLNSNISLRKTAEKYGVSYRALFKWVKWYKEKGELRLLSTYRRAWNRTPEEIEKRVAYLKEKNPALSLRKAKKILEKQGIRISIKGIWNIWKRYALTARPREDPYSPFGYSTKEIEHSLKRVKELLRNRKLEEAARVVNSMPSFPKDPVLTQIPEQFLIPRRRLELLFLSFGKVSFAEYSRKAREIRKLLEKNELFYSSIFAGFAELVSLHWMGAPGEELKIIKTLKKRIKNMNDPSLKYLICMHEGIIYAKHFNYEKARKHIRKCVRLIKSLPYPFFYDSLGSFFSYMKDNKNVAYYLNKAYERESKEWKRRILSLKIASTCAIGGRYREALTLLRHSEKYKEGYSSSFFIVSGFCAFGQGNILKALSFLRKAMEKSERGEIRNHIHATSLGFASIKAALGDLKEAKDILVKYLPVFKKYKMKSEILITNSLLRKGKISKQLEKFPVFRLLSFLQKGEYYKALKIAREKELLGLFHRYIVFFPELIRELLDKGKSIHLPKVILRFPVFNKHNIVFNVKFMGDLIIYRNKKYIYTNLGPKEKALLIHIALNLPEPSKFLSLDKIYENFWRYSSNPHKNLTHILSRIRRKLKIPFHLLEISKRKGILINRGIYFTTDYQEFEHMVSQARVFLRSGEWKFAKRDFLDAFRLIRGEPFKKMYDRWSEDTRLKIIFRIESIFSDFIDECLKQEEERLARKIHRKAIRIIRYSDELKNKLTEEKDKQFPDI